VEINGVDVTDMEFRHVLDLLKNMILRKSSSGNCGIIGDGVIPLKSLGFAPFFVQRNCGTGRGRDGGLVVSSGGSGGFLSSLIWSGGGTSNNGAIDAVAGNGRRRNGGGGGGGGGLVGGGMAWNIAKNRQLYAFTSTIKRIRMNHGSSATMPLSSEDDSATAAVGRPTAEEASSFVQYEITCQLTVQCTNKRRDGGDRQISWSVWKRYSEFQTLDAKLRKTFGWRVTDLNGGWGVAFPPSRHLRCMWVSAWNDSGGGGCKHNKLWQKQQQERSQHPSSSRGGGGTTRVDDRTTNSTTMHQKFVRNRREELKKYWDSLGECEEMFDFADPSLHRYSRDIAKFLGLERYFPRSGGSSGGVGRRATSTGTGGGSVIGDSSLQGTQRRNFNGSSTIEMEASTMSQQSPQLSSRCDQSNSSNLPLGENNHGGEIIVTKESIETSSLLANSPLLGSGGGRKQKRVAAAAKPAFQRRLLDSL